MTERFPSDLREDVSNPADTELGRTQRSDDALQPDPELTEGPASTGKIAMAAVGVAILLGAVFYGLNNSSTGNNQAGSPPVTQSAQTKPNAPSNNATPGMTTGAATNRPTSPASSATGNEIDRTASQPAGKTNNTN